MIEYLKPELLKTEYDETGKVLSKIYKCFGKYKVRVVMGDKKTLDECLNDISKIYDDFINIENKK